MPPDSDSRPNRLDNVLRQRAFEPASSNLPERIIMAARSRPVRAGFGAWLADLLAAFLPVRPAYALASVLMLGVVIGASLPAAGGEREGLGYYEEEDAL